MKKILILLFAVAALAVLFCVAASAEATVTPSFSEEAVRPQDNISVDLTFSGNTGVCLLQAEVSFDKTALELVSVAGSALFLSSSDTVADANTKGKLTLLFEASDISADITANGKLTALGFRALVAGTSSIEVLVKDALKADGSSALAGFTAASATVVCAVNYAAFTCGENTVYLPADGSVTFPEKPGDVTSALAGWYGTVDGTPVFLPAGASLNCKEASFEAILLDITTDSGASMRINSRTGLRFLTKIKRVDYDRLSAITGTVTGTVIVPDRYAKTAGGADVASISAAGYTQWLEMTAGSFFGSDSDYYYLAGSVVDIREKNYALKFAASGYVEVTYTDSSAVRIHAAYVPENSRSIYDVALAAYSDRSQTETVSYKHQINGTYSPYSESDCDIMLAFLNAVPNFTDSGLPVPFSNEYYTSPFTGTVSRAGNTVTLSLNASATVPFDRIKAVLYNGDAVFSDCAVISGGKLVFTFTR